MSVYLSVFVLLCVYIQPGHVEDMLVIFFPSSLLVCDSWHFWRQLTYLFELMLSRFLSD